MNEKDIKRENFTDGQWIVIQSQVGSAEVQIFEAPIRSGNVGMFYPEGNQVIPAEIDPQSKTPAFKRTTVQLAPKIP